MSILRIIATALTSRTCAIRWTGRSGRARSLQPLAAASCAALLLAPAVLARAAEDGDGPVIGRTYAESREGRTPAPPDARGKPNIVWILLDDAGFSASSAFGGLVATPTMAALARDGLRYTNFHTAGVCAPTRAALLTGRNHHQVGMGLFPNRGLTAEFPGYTGRLEPRSGTIAQYLRAAGYSTYALGKWHLTPDAETSDIGPFERWPLGKGFDHYFGFLGAVADQYKPDLVEDNQRVQPDGRHLNAQLADKAIAYIDRQLRLAPEKPFFLYLAPGATHAPHQVDKPWIDRYRGRFDAGWDVYRRETFARQRAMGLVSAKARLPARDARVPAWNSLSPDQKRVYARLQEAYAGFLEYTDYEIGRIVAHLREQGLLENTAIFVLTGDNGASKEGAYNGSIRREFASLPGDDAVQIAELLANLDQIGTGTTYSNYPIGWAEAMNTPFRLWKGDANTEGATRNPLIVHWPRGLAVHGEIRHQYSHVVDLLPTVLEMTGVKAPAVLGREPQDPIQGVSLVYSFADAVAPARRTQQYYFLFGAGAIVSEGWKASFGYRPDYVDLVGTYPAPTVAPNNAGKEVWQLYNLDDDPTETRDLSRQRPDKLRELQQRFDAEARANHVYPLMNFTDVYDKIRALQN